MPRERDLGEHLVRRRARPRVGSARDLGRQLRVLARLVELAQLEQRRGRADVGRRLRRLQLDEVLVGVERVRS